MQTTTLMCIQVLKMFSQTICSTWSKKKAAKRGEKAKIKQSSLQDMCLFSCYSLGESWHVFLHICREFYWRCYMVWPSSTSMSMTQLCSGESSFYKMFWVFASIFHVFCIFLKASLYFSSPTNRSTMSFVDKNWKES